MRAATSALPWVLGLSVASCNAISGIGDLTRSDSVVQSDGGTLPCGGADLTSDASNCGTCGHACGTGNFCSSSACIQGCTGGTLYVSPTGNDMNDGCSIDKPLLTIAKSASLAKAQGNALVQEVHVCKGVYKEPGITVDFKSSLRGGYSCTDWKRTASFGYPLFDQTNLTEIDSNVMTGSTISTLTVGGTGVDASVIIDGFLIQGSSAPATTIALALGAGAPTIKDDFINGGSPTESASPNASIGIQIGGGGSPEITSCNIDGGGGVTTSTSTSANGSTGIIIAADSGSPNIHASTIAGGSGTAPSGDGSIAVAVNGGSFATANGIRANAITGGTGKIGVSGVASVGVVSIASGNVELDANEILGGAGSCAKASGSCSSFGIVAGVGNLIVRGNKIYGGDATGSTNGGSAGITVSGLKSFIAENNMIHGGNKSSAATHGSARAIELTQTPGASIRNNTLYSGNAGSGSSSALVIDTQTSAIILDNNILATPVGSGSVPAVDITLACSANLVKSVQNNAFIAPDNAMIYAGNGVGTGSCTGSTKQTLTNVSDVQTFLASTATGATVSNNVRLASSCGADSACAVNASCTSDAACVAAIVTGWTAPDTGEGVLESTGWKTNAICPVAQGGLDLSAGLTIDLYGNARTVPFSIGAHEQDATCL